LATPPYSREIVGDSPTTEDAKGGHRGVRLDPHRMLYPVMVLARERGDWH
jgi:hypothetical protein